ncbi:hypothetical protein ASC97_04255 [Rhizobium sp. Root1203]|uniref:hypothetical protein n=1 Tax=Rhizobium sp. Root1203 TaxID=1736427 RepID=UPI0007090859|nr:hypothetical protein [Rhizobium sp. Root1203]KQV27596.1 hypothetical protein ASC97_04255 [Rhizobium sp. Root1203]
MSSKTITIVFPQGGIIPASVLGEPADVDVPAQKPVKVPFRYGRHLIDDRFAVEATATVDGEGSTPSSEKKTAAKKAAVDDAADKARAQAIAEAEARVATASVAVSEAGDDMVKKAEAADELKAAEDALAVLRA